MFFLFADYRYGYIIMLTDNANFSGLARGWNDIVYLENWALFIKPDI
jgi:hypothetical protein